MAKIAAKKKILSQKKKNFLLRSFLPGRVPPNGEMIVAEINEVKATIAYGVHEMIKLTVEIGNKKKKRNICSIKSSC